MKDLTKEEQELVNRFNTFVKEWEWGDEVFITDGYEPNEDIKEFLLSEIRTAVERERKLSYQKGYRAGRHKGNMEMLNYIADRELLKIDSLK